MFRVRLSIGMLLSVCSIALAASVWDGVYTKGQAARGQAVYQEECLKCHGETLGGGESAPALAGAEFLAKWNGKSAGDLLALIRKSMPTDDPGNLSSKQYADVVAYVLSVNEFPAGATELARDAAQLQEIRIEGKPRAGDR